MQLWNENKLEEALAGFYTDDAVLLAPNHEPIEGRTAILALLQTMRDEIGEFDEGEHLIRAKPSGDDSVSWVRQYTFRGGNLRVVTHELPVRQHDGSMKNAVDMVGYRDPNERDQPGSAGADRHTGSGGR